MFSLLPLVSDTIEIDLKDTLTFNCSSNYDALVCLCTFSLLLLMYNTVHTYVCMLVYHVCIQLYVATIATVHVSCT